MKKAKDVSLDKKSLAWYEKHKDNIEEKRLKYWPKWMEKSEEDKAARTLNVSDGVTL